MFENLLNPIFAPLLDMPILWAVAIISFIVSLIITLIYKFATDQVKMKELKTRLKDHQKEMKEHRNNPQKVMEINKQAMQVNMEYMKHSMRSTLFTILPILIIFGWLNAHLAYEPLIPDQEFSTKLIFKNGITGEAVLNAPEGITLINNNTQDIVNNEAIWQLKGKQGEYLLEYEYGSKKYSKDIVVTNEREYKQPFQKVNDGTLKTIEVDNKKVKVLNLFGWRLGWLGTYIIFSIIFSMVLRKMFKLH